MGIFDCFTGQHRGKPRDGLQSPPVKSGRDRVDFSVTPDNSVPGKDSSTALAPGRATNQSAATKPLGRAAALIGVLEEAGTSADLVVSPGLLLAWSPSTAAAQSAIPLKVLQLSSSAADVLGCRNTAAYASALQQFASHAEAQALVSLLYAASLLCKQVRPDGSAPSVSSTLFTDISAPWHGSSMHPAHGRMQRVAVRIMPNGSQQATRPDNRGHRPGMSTPCLLLEHSFHEPDALGAPSLRHCTSSASNMSPARHTAGSGSDFQPQQQGQEFGPITSLPTSPRASAPASSSIPCLDNSLSLAAFAPTSALQRQAGSMGRKPLPAEALWSMVMAAEVPCLVTLLSPKGVVLFQNDLSREYYGDLVGAAATWAQYIASQQQVLSRTARQSISTDAPTQPGVLRVGSSRWTGGSSVSRLGMSSNHSMAIMQQQLAVSGGRMERPTPPLAGMATDGDARASGRTSGSAARLVLLQQQACQQAEQGAVLRALLALEEGLGSPMPGRGKRGGARRSGEAAGEGQWQDGSGTDAWRPQSLGCEAQGDGGEQGGEEEEEEEEVEEHPLVEELIDEVLVHGLTWCRVLKVPASLAHLPQELYPTPPGLANLVLRRTQSYHTSNNGLSPTAFSEGAQLPVSPTHNQMHADLNTLDPRLCGAAGAGLSESMPGGFEGAISGVMGSVGAQLRSASASQLHEELRDSHNSNSNSVPHGSAPSSSRPGAPLAGNNNGNARLPNLDMLDAIGSPTGSFSVAAMVAANGSGSAASQSHGGMLSSAHTAYTASHSASPHAFVVARMSGSGLMRRQSSLTRAMVERMMSTSHAHAHHHRHTTSSAAATATLPVARAAAGQIGSAPIVTHLQESLAMGHRVDGLQRRVSAGSPTSAQAAVQQQLVPLPPLDSTPHPASLAAQAMPPHTHAATSAPDAVLHHTLALPVEAEKPLESQVSAQAREAAQEWAAGQASRQRATVSGSGHCKPPSATNVAAQVVHQSSADERVLLGSGPFHDVRAAACAAADVHGPSHGPLAWSGRHQPQADLAQFLGPSATALGSVQVNASLSGLPAAGDVPLRPAPSSAKAVLSQPPPNTNPSATLTSFTRTSAVLRLSTQKRQSASGQTVLPAAGASFTVPAAGNSGAASPATMQSPAAALRAASCLDVQPRAQSLLQRRIPGGPFGVYGSPMGAAGSQGPQGSLAYSWLSATHARRSSFATSTEHATSAELPSGCGAGSTQPGTAPTSMHTGSGLGDLPEGGMVSERDSGPNRESGGRESDVSRRSYGAAVHALLQQQQGARSMSAQQQPVQPAPHLVQRSATTGPSPSASNRSTAGSASFPLRPMLPFEALLQASHSITEGHASHAHHITHGSFCSGAAGAAGGMAHAVHLGSLQLGEEHQLHPTASPLHVSHLHGYHSTDAVPRRVPSVGHIAVGRVASRSGLIVSAPGSGNYSQAAGMQAAGSLPLSHAWQLPGRVSLPGANHKGCLEGSLAGPSSGPIGPVGSRGSASVSGADANRSVPLRKTLALAAQQASGGGAMSMGGASGAGPSQGGARSEGAARSDAALDGAPSMGAAWTTNASVGGAMSARTGANSLSTSLSKSLSVLGAGAGASAGGHSVRLPGDCSPSCNRGQSLVHSLTPSELQNLSMMDSAAQLQASVDLEEFAVHASRDKSAGEAPGFRAGAEGVATGMGPSAANKDGPPRVAGSDACTAPDASAICISPVAQHSSQQVGAAGAGVFGHAEDEEAEEDEGVSSEGSSSMPGGSWCWHEVTVKRCIDPVNGGPALLLVQRNVTERAQLENTLSELTEAQLAMLSGIFPRHVIEALSVGNKDDLDMEQVAKLARSHADVTILFMDLVGFTSMSKEVPPEEVITFLNALFGHFDRLVEKHRVQKIDTIGDAYLVASGILAPDEEGFNAVDDHHEPADGAARVFAFARDMLRVARLVNMPHNGQPVSIRIGIHTGPCVSGLIGTKLPKWTVLGGTINTAARAEQTCQPDHVQVTEATRRLLPEGARATLQPTGGVFCKGIGMLDTYLWAPPPEWQAEDDLPSGFFTAEWEEEEGAGVEGWEEEEVVEEAAGYCVPVYSRLQPGGPLGWNGQIREEGEEGEEEGGCHSSLDASAGSGAQQVPAVGGAQVEMKLAGATTADPDAAALGAHSLLPAVPAVAAKSTLSSVHLGAAGHNSQAAAAVHVLGVLEEHVSQRHTSLPQQAIALQRVPSAEPPSSLLPGRTSSRKPSSLPVSIRPSCSGSNAASQLSVSGEFVDGERTSGGLRGAMLARSASSRKMASAVSSLTTICATSTTALQQQRQNKQGLVGTVSIGALAAAAPGYGSKPTSATPATPKDGLGVSMFSLSGAGSHSLRGRSSWEQYGSGDTLSPTASTAAAAAAQLNTAHSAAAAAGGYVSSAGQVTGPRSPGASGPVAGVPANVHADKPAQPGPQSAPVGTSLSRAGPPAQQSSGLGSALRKLLKYTSIGEKASSLPASAAAAAGDKGPTSTSATPAAHKDGGVPSAGGAFKSPPRTALDSATGLISPPTSARALRGCASAELSRVQDGARPSAEMPTVPESAPAVSYGAEGGNMHACHHPLRLISGGGCSGGGTPVARKPSAGPTMLRSSSDVVRHVTAARPSSATAAPSTRRSSGTSSGPPLASRNSYDAPVVASLAAGSLAPAAAQRSAATASEGGAGPRGAVGDGTPRTSADRQRRRSGVMAAAAAAAAGDALSGLAPLITLARSRRRPSALSQSSDDHEIHAGLLSARKGSATQLPQPLTSSTHVQQQQFVQQQQPETAPSQTIALAAAQPSIEGSTSGHPVATSSTVTPASPSNPADSRAAPAPVPAAAPMLQQPSNHAPAAATCSSLPAPSRFVRSETACELPASPCGPHTAPGPKRKSLASYSEADREASSPPFFSRMSGSNTALGTPFARTSGFARASGPGPVVGSPFARKSSVGGATGRTSAPGSPYAGCTPRGSATNLPAPPAPVLVRSPEGVTAGALISAMRSSDVRRVGSAGGSPVVVSPALRAATESERSPASRAARVMWEDEVVGLPAVSSLRASVGDANASAPGSPFGRLGTSVQRSQGSSSLGAAMAAAARVNASTGGRMRQPSRQLPSTSIAASQLLEALGSDTPQSSEAAGSPVSVHLASTLKVHLHSQLEGGSYSPRQRRSSFGNARSRRGSFATDRPGEGGEHAGSGAEARGERRVGGSVAGSPAGSVFGALLTMLQVGRNVKPSPKSGHDSTHGTWISVERSQVSSATVHGGRPGSGSPMADPSMVHPRGKSFSYGRLHSQGGMAPSSSHGPSGLARASLNGGEETPGLSRHGHAAVRSVRLPSRFEASCSEGSPAGMNSSSPRPASGSSARERVRAASTPVGPQSPRM